MNGRIGPTLLRLALPIMGTSLVQMAYNLTDMIWIGRLSADAVAAVGAAGMYLWISQGLATIPRITLDRVLVILNVLPATSRLLFIWVLC